MSKTKAELAAENTLLKNSKVTDGWISVINNFIKYGTMLGVTYLCKSSIVAFAGKDTNSNILIQLITDIHANQWGAYIFGGTGFFYGWSQKRLSKKTISRVSGRNQNLEKRIDARRSSSKLTHTGDTNPEDLI